MGANWRCSAGDCYFALVVRPPMEMWAIVRSLEKESLLLVLVSEQYCYFTCT